MDGCHDDVSDDDQSDKWEIWFWNGSIYITGEYYKDRPSKGVVVYKKDEIPSDNWDDNRGKWLYFSGLTFLLLVDDVLKYGKGILELSNIVLMGVMPWL